MAEVQQPTQINPQCVFCQIANKTADAAIIYEDDYFMLLLDKAPNTLGQALIISKQHYPPEYESLPQQLRYHLANFIDFAIKVLKNGLGVERVAVVIEGMGVPHFHVKLYPLHGVKKDSIIIYPGERVFFTRYIGFITTKMGPDQPLEILKKIAEEIKKKNGL